MALYKWGYSSYMCLKCHAYFMVFDEFPDTQDNIKKRQKEIDNAKDVTITEDSLTGVKYLYENDKLKEIIYKDKKLIID